MCAEELLKMELPDAVLVFSFEDLSLDFLNMDAMVCVGGVDCVLCLAGSVVCSGVLFVVYNVP